MKISIITPTHDAIFIKETYESVLAQTYQDWEWIVLANAKAKDKLPAFLRNNTDPRIKVIRTNVMEVTMEGDKEVGKTVSHKVGAIKRYAFAQATGDVLVELDHDDMLAPEAIEEIAKAFKDKKVGFVYSDFAEFRDKTWEPVFYNFSNGWEYYDVEYKGHKLQAAKAWEPSPAMISLVFYAPNHVRAWRKTVYDKIGGHDGSLNVCDDHELCIRTYLADVKMVRIPKCLYFYRVYDNNTFLQRGDEIQFTTWKLYNDNINQILLKWCRDNKLRAIDLGARFNKAEGFESVDLLDADVVADLNEKWPFEDGSVGVVRAYDFLEHTKSKEHIMSEIYRVLAPGGWLLSFTPSTDGRGAFQDPTHINFWNQNAFWYWTRAEQAQFIDNKDIRFQVVRNVTQYPNSWHQENKILYVTCDLIKLADGDVRHPGVKEI